MYSIEYIFRECNMHKHALGVELYTPIILCEKSVRNITILKVNYSEQLVEQLTRNVLNEVNTNVGVYSFLVSDNVGNPFNPQNIMLELQNIKGIWKV